MVTFVLTGSSGNVVPSGSMNEVPASATDGAEVLQFTLTIVGLLFIGDIVDGFNVVFSFH